MDRRAVEKARTEYDRAVQSIEALGRSNTRGEVETHWSGFLTSAGRVFSKLQQGAKASGSSKAWFGTKIDQRRTNPLLHYMWQSRNADEHTTIEVTGYQAAVVTQVSPTPEEIGNFHRVMAQQPLPYAALGMIEVTPPHMRLLPVAERNGTTYYPPPGLVPFEAGKQALQMLEQILNEAEARVI